MSLITFDFETFFDTKYTLKTLSYTDYIFDEKFKVHGAAVKIDSHPAYWLEPDQIPAFIDQHREDTWVFHNAQFDASILALVYNFTPRRIMDTMALAALLVGWYTRLDLGTLAIYFDCPLRKGKALASTKGLRVLQDHPAIYEELKEYACLDVEITYWLLQDMLRRAHELVGIDQQTLKEELAAINLTNQLILPHGEPLHIDLSVVQQALKEERQQKSEQIRAIAAQYQYSDHEFVKMLRSRTAFPAFMERLGVHLPTKISARTGKDTYALGKNDTALLALREQLEGTSEGEILALREDVSSTIKRTRSERILRMALRGEPTIPTEPLRGHLPVPVHINYAGASKTLRWSGGNKVNLQNLPRGSALRQAIIPPPGYKIVVCDYSSVEARVLGWLADDDDLLAVFRAGEDVYVNFGKKVWGELAMLEGSDAPEESEEYKPFKKRRFVSKTCTLGLGYSASWTVLERVLRTGSMGAKVVLDREICTHIGMDRQEIIQRLESMKEWVLRDEENGRARWAALMAPLQRDPSLLWHYGACMRLVEIYRTERWAVTNLWKQLEPKNLMATDRVGHIEAWVRNKSDLSLRLPGGSVLVFPQMRLERRGASFIRAGVPESTYGAKITENVTQGTARNLLRDAWIEADRAGLNVVLTVHDEIACVEKEQDAEAARDTLQAIMSRAPAWAEGLPVDAEAKIVDSYAEK